MFGLKKITKKMANFVPKYIGLSHTGGTTVKTTVNKHHTTEFARVLFAESKKDVTIAVAVDTYICKEKSGDHSFQNEVLFSLFSFNFYFLFSP